MIKGSEHGTMLLGVCIIAEMASPNLHAIPQYSELGMQWPKLTDRVRMVIHFPNVVKL